MPAWIQIQGNNKKLSMPHARNFCIGRHGDCDLQLDDPLASRNHAIVQHTGQGAYYLIDIASKNGCFLNTKRVTSPIALKDGDEFRIGDTVFLFTQNDIVEQKLDPSATMIITREASKLDIQEITILVADIRGFTALTESLSIELLSGIMNQWFEEVTDCIEKHGGILDKFIGDSVYARWSSRTDAADPIILALKAASDLNIITAGIINNFPDIPFPLNIGVGINTGHAALDIGAEGTAMGDAVNLAFRLEDQSKIIGKNVVLSENSWKHLNNTRWEDDDHAMQILVKGKKDPINIIGVNFDEVDTYLKSVD